MSLTRYLNNCELLILIVLAMCIPYTTYGASLIGVSSVSTIEKGQTVPIEWYLDTDGEVINAIDLALVFSSDSASLEAESGRSIVSLWVVSPFANNDEGTVVMTGGVPGGVSGVVPLFRTQVTGKEVGPVVFALAQTSSAYAHDGDGTSRAITMPQLQIAVVPPKLHVIESKTHPEQDNWYKENKVVFSFASDNTKKYSYTFTRDFTSLPDNLPEEDVGTVTYFDLPDGVYYFRLVEIDNNADMQDKGVYRVQIDRTPPEDFVPIIATSTEVFSGTPFISWSTVDKTSGVSKSLVKRGLFGFWKEAKSPHKVKRPIIGNTITVRSIDVAGNHKDASVPHQGVISTQMFFLILLLFGMFGGLLMRYSQSKRRI